MAVKLILRNSEGDVVQVACEGNMTLLPPTGQGDSLRDVAGNDCFKQKVLLDMARTDYIDSSGVSWILVVHSRFIECGGRLVLYSLSTRVRGTFDLLRLSTVLHLAADESAARALLGTGKA